MSTSPILRLIIYNVCLKTYLSSLAYALLTIKYRSSWVLTWVADTIQESCPFKINWKISMYGSQVAHLVCLNTTIFLSTKNLWNHITSRNKNFGGIRYGCSLRQKVPLAYLDPASYMVSIPLKWPVSHLNLYFMLHFLYCDLIEVHVVSLW